MEENKMTSKHHEPWIGGPETLLPFYVEAALAWILAFGLLSVSGYHYVMETLVKPYWTRIIQTYYYTMTTSTNSNNNNNNFSHHFTLFCQSWLWHPLSIFFYGPTTPSTIRNLRHHSRIAVSSNSAPSSSSSSSSSTLPCWLPLTTCSRSEMDRASPQERLQQLLILLQKIVTTTITSHNEETEVVHYEVKNQTRVSVSATQQQGETLTTWNDQQLITIMRGNVTLRRLATLAIRPVSVRNHGNSTITTTTTNNTNASSQIEVATLSSSLSALRQQLVHIWPALLRLPPPQDDDDSCHYLFEISLIIACFRERPSDVRLKLQHALNMARYPEKIQVVLVDAGGNTDSTSSSSSSSDDYDLQQVANEETMRCNSSSSSSPSLQHVTDRATSSNGNHMHFSTTADTTTSAQQQQQSKHCWGSIKIVNFFERQQGRGPALNAGAAHSMGRILAFLHSDTKLPIDWDMKLHDTFHHRRYNNKKEDHICNSIRDKTSDGGGDGIRANAAAFAFGIDMNGLSNNTSRCLRQATTTSFATVDDDDSPSSQHDSSSYYPPGLRAVQMTANLRCQLWSLPYGDQCLCLPRSIFDHVGGYPHQCFMEDYELIALLRRRQALVHKFFGKMNAVIQSSTMESTTTTATTTTASPLEQEALKIIPGPCALCSPRRWQRFGVLYVTYMNSRLVNLYHAHDDDGRLTPQDLYERYYGHALRDWHDLAPWEIQLYSEICGSK